MAATTAATAAEHVRAKSEVCTRLAMPVSVGGSAARSATDEIEAGLAYAKEE